MRVVFFPPMYRTHVHRTFESDVSSFQAETGSVLMGARQTARGTLDSHLTSAQTPTVSTPGTEGHVSY